MYNSKSVKSEEFIDHEEIMKVLEYGEKNKDNSEMVDEILKKAESLVGLDRYEVSVLLYACENKENKTYVPPDLNSTSFSPFSSSSTLTLSPPFISRASIKSFGSCSRPDLSRTISSS